MTDAPTGTGTSSGLPGVTACLLCAGETLGDADEAGGGQLARLRRLEQDGVARLTLVECLDACDRGDVLVVQAATSATRCTTWLERLAGDAPTAALADWLRAGAPCRESLPAALRVHRFAPEVAATGE